jgi:hypothetical protein
MTRSKTSWEAADSGLLIWRSGFARFFPFLIIPFGIMAGCLCLLPNVAWASLILWWLKPFFDRIIVHIIAIRFFEPTAGTARFLRGLRGGLTRGLAGDLLWRRFSPWRASHIPVRTLETTDKRSVTRRLRTLADGGLNFCALLTVLCLALESALLAGEWFFTRSMLELMRPDYVETLNHVSSAGVFLFVMFCVNYVLIESVYVCMGFGLYINSRMEVEGWDIELLFRRFASAMPECADAKPARNAVAPLLCLALCFFAPAPGYTQDAPTEVPLAELEEILASPDFGSKQETWGVRFKAQEEEQDFNWDAASWVEKIKIISAHILRVLVIIAAVVALYFVVRYFYRRNGVSVVLRKNHGNSAAGPVKEHPAMLLSRARAFYAEGRYRDAWAVCFAAALAAWSGRGLNFPHDATEYECLALVCASGASETADFTALVHEWVDFAYAGKAPPEGSFEKALTAISKRCTDE